MNWKVIISAICILLVLTLTIKSLGFIVKDFSDSVYEKNCEFIGHKPSDRNIVIRIDDIQAYYLRDLQMMMIEDALARNKTVSLSVIPFNLHNDKVLVTFLKKHRCNVEIGLHGYNNTDFEFEDISYIAADEKVTAGLKELNEIEKDVITFIPPNNECSGGCADAVYDSGIRVISSGFENKEFGFSVSTFNWTSRTFTDYEKVLEGCARELNKGETCIIMIHPQDYITNGKIDYSKYNQYIMLLNRLNELDATVVTFRDLYYKDLLVVE